MNDTPQIKFTVTTLAHLAAANSKFTLSSASIASATRVSRPAGQHQASHHPRGVPVTKRPLWRCSDRTPPNRISMWPRRPSRRLPRRSTDGGSHHQRVAACTANMANITGHELGSPAKW